MRKNALARIRSRRSTAMATSSFSSTPASNSTLVTESTGPSISTVAGATHDLNMNPSADIIQTPSSPSTSTLAANRSGKQSEESKQIAEDSDDDAEETMESSIKRLKTAIAQKAEKIVDWELSSDPTRHARVEQLETLMKHHKLVLKRLQSVFTDDNDNHQSGTNVTHKTSVIDADSTKDGSTQMQDDDTDERAASPKASPSPEKHIKLHPKIEPFQQQLSVESLLEHMTVVSNTLFSNNCLTVTEYRKRLLSSLVKQPSLFSHIKDCPATKTIAELDKAVLSFFGGTTGVTAAVVRNLNNCRRKTGETISEYANRYQRLINAVDGELDNILTINSFINGLEPSLQERLRV